MTKDEEYCEQWFVLDLVGKEKSRATGSFFAPETDVGQDWLGMLDECAVQSVAVFPHGDSDLVEVFRSQPGWIVDSEDGEAVLLVRSDH